METKREKINKVVKVDGNVITVLQEAFEYASGFKGLTGSVFEAVSKSEFYEVLEPYLDNDKETLIYLDENFGDLNREIIEGVDSSEEALTDLFFDTSYSDMWDYLREELDLSEDEAYIFNCIGGGRCFSADDKFTHNRELEKYLTYEQE